jgi:hypothetical protein
MPELDARIAAKPDLILLDNMTVAQIREAVALAAGRVPLEASGGIRMGDIAAVAATGVDYVAMGELTHSARAVDVSLKLEPSGPDRRRPGDRRPKEPPFSAIRTRAEPRSVARATRSGAAKPLAVALSLHSKPARADEYGSSPRARGTAS